MLWKATPVSEETALVKLGVYVSALTVVGLAASRGALPRTRPIVPGELMVAD